MTDAHMLRIVFGSVLLVVGGLWLISLPVGALAGDFWSLRGSLIYGAGVLAHAVILIDRTYWTAPLGPVLALLMLGGVSAAMTALLRRTGASRRVAGRIRRLTPYAGNAMLDVEVQLETAWPGHQAGQFAFLNLGGVEGAHPFTIASAWRRDGRLTFSIKGLGDYTRLLPDRLFVDQAVAVEGPYGRFDFREAPSRQVWIAGGVGITPFIARLQALADERKRMGQAGAVDLVYSTNTPDEAFIDQIRQLAVKAGVRFHLLVAPRDGLLTLDRLASWIPDWKAAGIWFCGPTPFGRALRKAMTASGMLPAHFHQEFFEMR